MEQTWTERKFVRDKTSVREGFRIKDMAQTEVKVRIILDNDRLIRDKFGRRQVWW